MEDRTCKRCEIKKPLSGFSLHPKSHEPIGVCRDCMPQYRRRQSPRHHKHQWAYNDPRRRTAHKAVENALIRGDLKALPCERCGDAVGVHAHHDDYDQPLEVMWLCPLHHKQRHRELRASQQQVA